LTRKPRFDQQESGPFYRRHLAESCDPTSIGRGTIEFSTVIRPPKHGDVLARTTSGIRADLDRDVLPGICPRNQGRMCAKLDPQRNRSHNGLGVNTEASDVIPRCPNQEKPWVAPAAIEHPCDARLIVGAPKHLASDAEQRCGRKSTSVERPLAFLNDGHCITEWRPTFVGRGSSGGAPSRAREAERDCRNQTCRDK